MERHLRAKRNTACDRQEAGGRIHADCPLAGCDRAPKTARHRIGPQLVGRICEDFGFRYRALDRSRQGRQYQDGAVALRRSGETRESTTVAIAATATLRISAPSPT